MIQQKKLLSVFLTILLLTSGCSNKIVSGLQKNGSPTEAPKATKKIEKKASQLLLANDLANKGQQLFLAKHYDHALANYKRAFEVRSKTPGSFHISLTDNLYHIATIHEAKEQYSDAEKSYRQAINILKQNKQQSSINNFLGYLTAVQYQNSFHHTAKDINNLLTAYKQIHDPDNIRISAIKHRLANLHLNTKNFTASKTAFKNALLIFQQHTGTNHPYYALILKDYAKLLLLTKQNKQAKQLRDTALSILSQFPEKKHTKLYQIN